MFLIFKIETDTVKINTELEKQFNEGLHTNMNRTHHLGLGFGGASGYSGTGVTTKSTSNTRKTFDDDDDDDDKKNKEDSASKKTSTKNEDNKTSPAKSDAKSSKYAKL